MLAFHYRTPVRASRTSLDEITREAERRCARELADALIRDKKIKFRHDLIIDRCIFDGGPSMIETTAELRL